MTTPPNGDSAGVPRANGDSVGVPRVSGTWDVPPMWFCLVFMLIGVGLLSAAAYLAWQWLLQGSIAGITLLPLLAVGAGFSAVGGLLLRFRRTMRGLASDSEMQRRLGLDRHRLRELAASKGVRPRYNVNGRDFYDPLDFGDPALLLRASDRPHDPANELLRPAGGAPGDNGALVRPASGRDSEEPPTVRQTISG